jgi:hypothetical protein
MDIADGAMEKTWAHGAVGFDDRGHPWRVALGSTGGLKPQMSPEVANNPSKLCRTFGNVARLYLFPSCNDQTSYLIAQR